MALILCLLYTLLEMQSSATHSVLDMFFLYRQDFDGLLVQKRIELVYLDLLLWLRKNLSGHLNSVEFYCWSYRYYASTSNWVRGA